MEYGLTKALGIHIERQKKYFLGRPGETLLASAEADALFFWPWVVSSAIQKPNEPNTLIEILDLAGPWFCFKCHYLNCL